MANPQWYDESGKEKRPNYGAGSQALSNIGRGVYGKRVDEFWNAAQADNKPAARTPTAAVQTQPQKVDYARESASHDIPQYEGTRSIENAPTDNPPPSAVSALPQRARDMGVDDSWTAQPQYEGAAIYRKGNSFAGYGTMSPEQQDAEAHRAALARENIMGIYDRESRARHGMSAAIARYDGRNEDANALMADYKTLYPAEIDRQRLANAGEFARQGLANRGQLGVTRLQGENTLSAEELRGKNAIGAVRAGFEDPTKGALADQARANAEYYRYRTRAPQVNPLLLAAIGGYSKGQYAGMDAKRDATFFENANRMFGGQGKTRVPASLVRQRAAERGYDPDVAEAQAREEGILVEGHATGGAISAAPAPLMQAPRLPPGYPQYAATAAKYGATLVSPEEYGAMQYAALAQRMQPQSFAAGGAVENQDAYDKLSVLGGPLAKLKMLRMERDALQPQLEPQPQPQPQPQPSKDRYSPPTVLGGSFNPYGNAPVGMAPDYAQRQQEYRTALERINSAPKWEKFDDGGPVPSRFNRAAQINAQERAITSVPYTPQAAAAPRPAPSSGQAVSSNPTAWKGGLRARGEFERMSPEDRQQYNDWAQYQGYPGYAAGGDIPPEQAGAIPVGGKQVLGAGDGKSDSIPAVIDGERPAALSTGEFVMPVETVQFFGLDKLRKMVAQSRKGPDEGAATA